MTIVMKFCLDLNVSSISSENTLIRHNILLMIRQNIFWVIASALSNYGALPSDNKSLSVPTLTKFCDVICNLPLSSLVQNQIW